MIPFAQFAPDRSDFDPDVTDSIVNAIPRPTGYGPFPGFSFVSSALAAQPRGGLMTRTAAGAYEFYAATATALYKFNTTTSGWTDVSQAATTYAVPAEGAWSMVQFGDLLVAVNGVDTPQAYNIASPATFVDLGGSPPVGKYASIVGDFLVFGSTDSYGTRSVAWSALNDAESWTPRRYGSDFQVFPSGGEVLGVAGSPRGAVVFQDNAIREMSLALNTPYVFTFQETDDSKTVIAPRSIVTAGGSIYFLTLQGFFRYGQPPQPIGDERIDRFFQQDADIEYLWQAQGAADPINKIVYWRYKSNGHNSTTTTDKVLIYNYAMDRWSIANVELSWICSATSPGETLEDLDALGYTLETLPSSLDSRVWSGGTPLIAGFDSSYRLGFFSGDPLEAVLQTGDVRISPQRAFVRGFRPVCDAETVTGRVAVKDRHGADRTWGGSASNERTGLIPARASGRLHRFEVTIADGADWSHCHGVEPEAVPEGEQ